MVLDSKQTTVAYRCPECGVGIMSPVGIFALSADMVKLKCSCKKSEMGIVYKKDSGTVRMSVPCIFCDKPHNFNVNSSVFFSRDVFLLPCPYSGVNIGFMGEENSVKSELARTELELLDMLEENGIEDFHSLRMDNQTLTDPQILDIILYVIKDLDADGKIFCSCHPNGRDPLPDGVEERDDSSYDVEFTDEGIKVICTECGDHTLIYADSLLMAHAFLNADSLTLDKKS